MRNAIIFLAIASGFLAAAAADDADVAKPKPTKPVPKAEFTKAGHTVDSVKDVELFVKSKRAVLLDVREKEEWDAGHLKLAKLVPLSLIRKGELPKKLAKRLPKDKPIYLHCRSGGRVLMAAEILKPKGYDIRPLRAGYEKLLESGFEKADPESKTRPNAKKDKPKKEADKADAADK